MPAKLFSSRTTKMAELKEKKIISRLLMLINTSRVIGKGVSDFGLWYAHIDDGTAETLKVGVRRNYDSKLEFERLIDKEEQDFDKSFPVKEIKFNTAVEVIDYVLGINYEMSLEDIYGCDLIQLSDSDFEYYESDIYNTELKNVILEIRNYKSLEDKYWVLNEEKTKNLYEFEYKEFFVNKIDEIETDGKLYPTGYEILNIGAKTDNITGFRIVDYSIEMMRGTKKPKYSLSVGFQIYSFLNLDKRGSEFNVYYARIKDFLVFPSEPETAQEWLSLQNSLKLLLHMTNEEIISLIIRNYDAIEADDIGIVSENEIFTLKEFKSRVLSDLSKYLIGLFYVGSEEIFTVPDILNLRKEFVKRTFGKKSLDKLFAEFALCSTGLKIEDLNTVNSFYTMLEQIEIEQQKKN